MNHVMIDLEALGKNKNAPIASIGAVFFEPETGELGEKFYCRVDFENDMKNGAIPDGDTIKWWLKQASEARAELVSDDAISLWRAVNKFEYWLTEVSDNLSDLKVWANSPSFDCVIWCQRLNARKLIFRGNTGMSGTSGQLKRLACPLWTSDAFSVLRKQPALNITRWMMRSVRSRWFPLLCLGWSVIGRKN